MELSQAYATRIKQLMKENHVNLYKLSKMSGVPHPTISVLLRRDIVFRLDTQIHVFPVVHDRRLHDIVAVGSVGVPTP